MLMRFEGFHVHILGTVSEWVVGIMFICYFCTFIPEFLKYTVTVDLSERQVLEVPPVLTGYRRLLSARSEAAAGPDEQTALLM